jgi:hypothetical protein
VESGDGGGGGFFGSITDAVGSLASGVASFTDAAWDSTYEMGRTAQCAQPPLNVFLAHCRDMAGGLIDLGRLTIDDPGEGLRLFGRGVLRLDQLENEGVVRWLGGFAPDAIIGAATLGGSSATAGTARATARSGATAADDLARAGTNTADDLARIAPQAGGSGTGIADRGLNVVQSSGRTFVSTPGGTTYDIPEGWIPRVADNGRGIVYQRPGSAGNANMIRIMDPTAKYPSGYVRYYNPGGQPLDVFGNPGLPSATHIPQDYQGPWPGWPG